MLWWAEAQPQQMLQTWPVFHLHSLLQDGLWLLHQPLHPADIKSLKNGLQSKQINNDCRCSYYRACRHTCNSPFTESTMKMAERNCMTHGSKKNKSF